ncbi:MAG: phosphatase PAP2 family protein [Holophaga sp.]|nr:phosphatase PAP2 family protein [Holophaga sp.]
MNIRPWRLLLAPVLCASLMPVRAAAPDWAAIVGSYPQPGTAQAREEAAILLWLQDTRTRADLARVQAGHPDLDLFLAAAGASWGASSYPGTKALLKQAREDMKPVVAGLKASFARPRPHVTDPALDPALPDDGSFSFPSKHATEGTLFASLLAQVDPYDRVAMTEEGRLIGDDRAMAGAHWPSDVMAGQKLGKAFATYWLGLAENAGLCQDAAAEWNGAKSGGRRGYLSMGTRSSAGGMSELTWASAGSLVRCRLSSR